MIKLAKRWVLNKEVAALRDICADRKPTFATFSFMVLPVYFLFIGFATWIVGSFLVSWVFSLDDPFINGLYVSAVIFVPLIAMSFIWSRKTALLLESEWYAKHWSARTQLRAQNRLNDVQKSLADLT